MTTSVFKAITRVIQNVITGLIINQLRFLSTEKTSSTVLLLWLSIRGICHMLSIATCVAGASTRRLHTVAIFHASTAITATNSC